MPDNRLIGREVVVTEKMDGENTTMYCDNIHARSIDGRHHPSRDWVKMTVGEIHPHNHESNSYPQRVTVFWLGHALELISATMAAKILNKE